MSKKLKSNKIDKELDARVAELESALNEMSSVVVFLEEEILLLKQIVDDKFNPYSTKKKPAHPEAVYSKKEPPKPVIVVGPTTLW
jgi:hypothetical protein